MIDIMSMLAAAAHWCVSCANDANVLPAGLGIAGGAAGAAGGVAGMAPLGDLYPPGTTADDAGNLTWTNPDGTTSSRASDGTVTNVSGNVTTVKYPDGYTSTSNAAEGTSTFTNPYGENAETFPSPDLPIPKDPAGNALASGLLMGPLLGGVEAAADGATTAGQILKGVADGAVDLGKDTAKDAVTDSFIEGGGETPAPGQVIGQSGVSLTNDGTVVTTNPDGSYTVPNNDGSTTTVGPDGTSTTTPPTATPTTGGSGDGS
jgi:hypothetical protein